MVHCLKCGALIDQGANDITSDELRMHYMNTERLYNGSYVSWVKNYKKKMDKGVYNRQLALKGIRYSFVPLIIKSYYKEYSKFPVDSKTRDLLAERIVEDIESDIKEGQFE